MMGGYLWAPVNYKKNKWARLLLISEIAYKQASSYVFAEMLSSE